MAVYEEFPVQFEKEAGVPIGVNIADVGWFMQPKAAVESIAPTSAAHSLLFVGDEVLSINGVAVSPVAKARSRIMRKELNRDALFEFSRHVKRTLTGCAAVGGARGE